MDGDGDDTLYGDPGEAPRGIACALMLSSVLWIGLVLTIRALW
ncbi:hypothetical protein [Roseicella frigidaeris]|nr:hypothetical protein [Roseicella frigidaeris]